jgi:NAD(P)H-hydrate epimerase
LHKGDAGRVVIIGGCAGDTFMAGAPALAAMAAMRSGAGLVQMFVPEEARAAAVITCPVATARTLPVSVGELLKAVEDYSADVVALGPGLGASLSAEVVIEFLQQFSGPVVVDADGLNLLATMPAIPFIIPQRIVLTPHPGEARRLLAAAGQWWEIGSSTEGRKEAVMDLVGAFGCNVVLKGHGTIVSNGERLFINATGNSGMATGGAGDVLTGIIAALIGQKMVPLEAAILGVHLHGLAGDFAAEELGRHSLMAMDLIDYLPEAFCEHSLAEGG